MNPQMCVLLCLAEGTSTLKEGVWESRFRYTKELACFGAEIQVDQRIAIVEGKGQLTGAEVKAVDLRAGAAMVIAGLAASGTTVVGDIHHIERGYEKIVEKLRAVGADISKITVSDDDSTALVG